MEKPFVLIIEDERDTAALFRFVIEMAGFRTEIAFHGQAALERLSNSRPEMVILDLNLPGVSGSELLEMIRKDERLSQTKVIVVTAYAHIAESLSLEPDLVLYKPLNLEQLSNLIRRFMVKENLQRTTPIYGAPLDNITGLYSKPFLVNRLDCLVQQSKEIEQYQFAVITFNLDPKRIIQTQFSSSDWNSVLGDIAKSLRSAIRPTDTISRSDQDDFYCLIENIPNENIPFEIASRIQNKLQETLSAIGIKEIPIRIGVLLCNNGYTHIDEILRDVEMTRTIAYEQAASIKILDRASVGIIASKQVS